MAFPSTTYIPQGQQAELASDFPQHGFSYQHMTHSAHPQAPIPVGQTASSTLQTQDLASQPDLLSHPYVQTLERQLDIALRKAHEYEDTILHQAALSRHFLSFLKTQHGIVCPDFKQEVVHACSSPDSAPSLQTPLSRYEYQPPVTQSNPSGLRPHFSSSSGQGNTFESTTANGSFETSTSHVQLLPPLNLTPNSFNSYPPTSVTLGNSAGLPMPFADPSAQESCFGGTVAGRSASGPFESSVRPPRQNNANISSLPRPHPPAPVSPVFSSGATSSSPPLCVPGSIHSPYNFCNDSSRLGKRDVHHADLECEQERKRARSSLLEEKHTNQQREFYQSQGLATSGPRLLSFENSLPPFPTIFSTPEGVTSSVPGSHAAALEDDIASEPENVAGWSITYNNEDEREVEVSMLRPLEMAREISSMKFSKDGKYLAVGFYSNPTTNIYDVQTGEKTCTLREFSYYEKNDGDRISIDAVCFSPNGLYLATGGAFDVVRIWEISKKHVRNVLNRWDIDHVDFSPNGRFIASSSRERRSLEVRNWRDDFRIFFYESDSHDDILDIHFSPEGRHIAATMDGDVMIWNVRTGQLVAKSFCSGVTTCVAFMPNGTGLVSGVCEPSGCVSVRFLGSRLQNGRLHLTENGTEVNLSEDQFDFCCGVAVSSNSRWVVSCLCDGLIQIFNAQSTDLQCVLSPRMYTDMTVFDFSPVSGVMAVSTWERNQVFLWRFKEISDSL